MTNPMTNATSLPKVDGRVPVLDEQRGRWLIITTDEHCYLSKNGQWLRAFCDDSCYWPTRAEAEAFIHACARRELVEQGKAKELPGGGLLMVGEGPHNPRPTFTREQMEEFKRLKAEADADAARREQGEEYEQVTADTEQPRSAEYLASLCDKGTRPTEKENVPIPDPDDSSTPPPAETSRGLNLDHDEARALHRIVRAMHDGECPKCHKIHTSERMERWDGSGDTGQGERFFLGWVCPSCKFSITGEEAAAVFQSFAPFMERNLAIFEKWRAERIKQ